MHDSSTKHIIDGLSQAELFQKISDICTVVNMVTSDKELLEVSLKKTMDLFGASRGSIFILKENGKDLILKIACGMAYAEQQSMIKRIGEGIVGRVAELKKPIFVDDIAQDTRFKDYKPRKSYRTPSFLCAPLIIKDSLIGVINITDKESNVRFRAEELQLLDFISSQIALNYRRVQLYEKFKLIIKESKTLKDELGKTSQEATHLKRQIIAQEKLATIGKLAGGIAHEFNNPLDGVIRYTNLCLEHVKSDEVVRGYLLEIKHGLDRMVNIVRSLLACSRNLPATMNVIETNAVINQVLTGLKSEIYHKAVVIEKDFRKSAKLVDLGLERVISNLLRNSIDAVEHGGKIKITTDLKSDGFHIEISDNGCGIPEGSLEKIFEPFYTTKDIDKGCGLGLTIVEEIVKNYSGQIQVASKLHHGTAFTIVLPRQEVTV